MPQMRDRRLGGWGWGKEAKITKQIKKQRTRKAQDAKSKNQKQITLGVKPKWIIHLLYITCDKTCSSLC